MDKTGLKKLQEFNASVKEFYAALQDFFENTDEEGYWEIPNVTPLLDEKDDINEHIESGEEFGVELVYGEMLQKCWEYDRSFLFRGFTITPDKTELVRTSGFLAYRNGTPVHKFFLKSEVSSELDIVIEPVCWDDIADEMDRCLGNPIQDEDIEY